MESSPLDGGIALRASQRLAPPRDKGPLLHVWVPGRCKKDDLLPAKAVWNAALSFIDTYSAKRGEGLTTPWHCFRSDPEPLVPADVEF